MKSATNRVMYTLAACFVLLGVYLFSMERNETELIDNEDELSAERETIPSEIFGEYDESLMPGVSSKGGSAEAMSSDATTAEYQQSDNLEFRPELDLEKKKQTISDLINRGMEYFHSHSLEETARAFTHTKEFVNGELYLFLYDITGRCLAHGEQAELVWKNLYDLRDSFGAYIVRDFIKLAEKGGGWQTYQWKGATKVSKIQPISKGKQGYIIGCGYYPHEKKDTVVNLVRGAVARFEDLIKQGWSDADAFGTLSYPLGDFVVGDLYIYALDFKGNIMAQGDRPGLIGQNSFDYRDSNGVYVNQEIIKALQKSGGEGIWVDYISRRTLKKAYAQGVRGKDGTDYFIACGYYPDANRNAAQDLVRRGFQLMKKSGLSFAAKEFSDKRNDEYRFGDLYLEIYDMEGKCIAHGGNEEYIGNNLSMMKDQDGRLFVQALIQEGKSPDGRGWIDAKLKNSFKSMYVERIDLGTNEYIIVCGLYPVSKEETMKLLVKSAVNKIEVGNSLESAFEAFTDLRDPFIRGDLGIFVFNQEGLCYVFGQHYELIWRNLLNQKDDEGRPFVRMMIDKVAQGAGSVDMKLNGAIATAYVEPVTVEGKQYVVGSMYYL